MALNSDALSLIATDNTTNTNTDDTISNCCRCIYLQVVWCFRFGENFLSNNGKTSWFEYSDTLLDTSHRCNVCNVRRRKDQWALFP